MFNVNMCYTIMKYSIKCMPYKFVHHQRYVESAKGEVGAVKPV